ncbi:hypothetical protein CFP65_6005 [Kitasatospora sp. MMS16-BH015]|nr:hypothetical protein CFP65_6005 [Kitasatospora sp. MMS16-BH015]
MRAEPHWSLATAGALSTANAVGYPLGAPATPVLTARAGERAALLGGYALDGAGYIASMTSLVAYLRQGGASAAERWAGARCRPGPAVGSGPPC